MGLTTTTARTSRSFQVLDDAVEWVEDQVLGESLLQAAELPPLEIYELEVFSDAKEEALIALVECLQRRSVAKDDRVFSSGDPADQLYLIRKGAVRITVPVPGKDISRHRLTYGRGDFFGGMSFISRAAHFSSDATAVEDTELYVLRREDFEMLREQHRRLAFHLIEGGRARACLPPRLCRQGTAGDAGVAQSVFTSALTRPGVARRRSMKNTFPRL
jgi:SulP family sulfate permease